MKLVQFCNNSFSVNNAWKFSEDTCKTSIPELGVIKS